MPRPAKRENENNALRQLRTLLKDPAEGGNISQQKLAEICQIPWDTIKSIEAGRMALSPNVRRKIAEETGAHWDYEKARWTRFDKTEFTFSFFSDYRQWRLKRPIIDKALVDSIHRRIDWLFEKVPDEDWERLRSRMNYFLEECKREYRITANDALFYHPASLGSANESAAAQPVKAGQQKRTSRRGQRGAIGGDKTRRRKYGL
jgi:hypothetical protein